MAGWLRRGWRPLLPAVGLIVVAFAISAAVAPTPFLQGVVIGGGLAFTTALFLFAALIGSDSMRFVLGALGEDATQAFFTSRPRRRAGWQLINGVIINGRDIDHIAVGPGGILAIETKWRSADKHSRDWAPHALRQAADAARIASNLIRQEAGTDVAAVPVLIEWGPGSPARTVMHDDGVISVTSKDLEPFERWLQEPRLGLEEVDHISAAMAGFQKRQLRYNAKR